jgi:hypothetical protein
MPDRTGSSAAKVCARCGYSVAVFSFFRKTRNRRALGRHKPLALKRNSSGTVHFPATALPHPEIAG